MKHIVIVLCYITIIIILLIGCKRILEEDGFVFAAFRNTSPITSFYVSLSTDYPDTVYNWEKGYRIRDNLFYQGQNIRFGNPRDSYFKKNRILQLFLFKDDGKSGYTDSVKWSKQFLRRYEFTREWMEEHNWTITYP